MNIDVKTSSSIPFGGLGSSYLSESTLNNMPFVVLFFMVLIIFYMVFVNIPSSSTSSSSSLGSFSNSQSDSSPFMYVLEIVLWGMLVFLVFIKVK